MNRGNVRISIIGPICYGYLQLQVTSLNCACEFVPVLCKILWIESQLEKRDRSSGLPKGDQMRFSLSLTAI